MNEPFKPQTIRMAFKKVESDDDIQAAFDLASTIWPICFKDIITEAQIHYMLSAMYSAETIRHETAAGTPFLLVELEGKTSGLISYDLLPNADGVVVLHKIYLLPDYWGKGIGNRLMTHVFHQASEAGASAVELNVNKANSRAIRAYERAGFFVKKSVKIDIGNGFEKNDFIMRKELK